MGTMQQPDLNERLAAILAICQKMNSERDLSPLLDLIAREATSLLDCDRASIFLLDRERNELWSKVALGSDEILRFDARRGIAGNAALTGDTINVRDAYSDPRFYTGIDDQTGYRTRNLLAVAVRNQHGEIIGAFEVAEQARRSVHGARRGVAGGAGVARGRSPSKRRSSSANCGAIRTSWRSRTRTCGARWRAGMRRHGIIGAGQRIQQIVRLIERIRDSVVNVLITGESGTGKELAAKAIHYTSPRARKPFVALNCAALPETLVESELFGIEKGVATGVNPRVGQFQKADGGTLFLDEIGDLSLTAQAEDPARAAGARGGARGRPHLDAGGCAACWRPRTRTWRRRSPRATFREDLYYRIKVIHIHMPPLREIREEIPLLANHFLQEYCRETGRGAMEFSPEVMRNLVSASRGRATSGNCATK